MSLKAFICGCDATSLNNEEKAFFKDHKPSGFILFQRNCNNSEQLENLIQSVKDCIGEDIFVLVDQEGGRVTRLKPPHWDPFPSALQLAEYFRNNPEEGYNKVRDAYQFLASGLRELGINVNCVPVLDIPVPGAHDIIGNRAYGTTPEEVISVSKAVIEGHLAAGVLPVIKHIPGHGRACSDSHEALPIISDSLDDLRATDFVPFKELNYLPLGMTGHLLLKDIDKDEPVSTSKNIISNIIRKEIGFNGLLMSDDLSMKALSGSMSDRARRSLEAGCDLALHCNGEIEEMLEVAEVAPVLRGASLARFKHAMAQFRMPEPVNCEEIQEFICEILANS